MAERRHINVNTRLGKDNQGTERRPEDPTQDEIRMICEAIQVNWSEQEEWSRRHFVISDGLRGGRRVVPHEHFTIPVVSNTDFENNIGEVKRSTHTIMRECF